MRVLVDTNILLDLILDREPFADAAALLWDAQRKGRFTGFISAISPVNIFYIIRKTNGSDKARRAVQDILTAFDVCTLDSAVLSVALTLALSDYEDAVQLASALAHKLDAVVTRDESGYRASPLPVFSPVDFLVQLPE